MEISVKTIFDGEKSDKQAFIDLILRNEKRTFRRKGVDYARNVVYTKGVVFPDVRAQEGSSEACTRE